MPGLEQPSSLFGCQPVPEAHPEPAYTFHATNPSRELRTEQTRIGRLVRDPSHRREPQVDRGRRVLALLQMDPIPQDDGPIEREAWFRAVPADELADGVVVGALAARRREAGEDRRLRVFEIRQREDALRRFLSLPGACMRHAVTASSPSRRSMPPSAYAESVFEWNPAEGGANGGDVA